MRTKLTSLLLCIFMFVIFLQCKDSVTQTTEPNPEPNSDIVLVQPTLLAPEINSEQSTSPTLEWKEIEEVELFQVQLSMDENFDSTTVDSTVESTAFQVEELPNDTTFYWQVRSVVGNDEGPWSESRNFKTINPSSSGPLTTELRAPDDGTEVRPDDLELKWQKVTSASAYKIQLADDQDFESLIIDKEVEATSYQASELDDSENYYWRVEPVSKKETEWSEVYEIVTNAEAEDTPNATLISPENNDSDQSTSLDLEWEEISGIDSYQVQLATSNDFSSPGTDETVSGTSYEVSGLDNDQTYYWRVQAAGDENAENWSETYEFTTETKAEPENETTPDATLISPEDQSGDQSTSLDLEWEEISSIDSYRLQMATNDDFSSPETDETVSSTSYEASDLDNDQTYYWRVQAAGDEDSGNWSSVRNFSTEKEPVDDGGDTPNSVEGDRQALLDLYEATGGGNWSNNSGWGSGDPSSSWHGIDTDGNGRVTRVDLFDNGLSGQLPESIGNLSKVKYMNLKKNYLTGEIPSSIGKMASLEWLILAGRTYEIGGTLKEPPKDFHTAYHQGKRYSNMNNFTGTIPSTIGHLSNLLRLEIANQPNIKGPIPSEIGDLSKLEGLYLSFNDFSGTKLPSSIGNLTNLKHLYIASAKLEGDIPPSLENLTQLRMLNLGESSSSTPDNHLTGEIPDFSNFTELRSIVLTDNNLTGEYPSYWNNGNFTHLHTLRFTWNNLTGTLHGLDNLPRLKSLGLEGNSLSGTIDEQLLEAPSNIRIIGLGWNNFDGEIPQSGWQDFSQIKTLYLNDNNLSGGLSCEFWDKLDNPKLGRALLQSNDFDSNCTSSMNDVEGNGDPEISVGDNNF